MENIQFTLVKSVSYDLLPFGRFKIMWNPSERQQQNLAVLPFRNVRFNSANCMPETEEQEKAIIKFMKKHKTDVLTDGYGYYSRMGNGFVEIYHPNIIEYRSFLNSNKLTDSEENFKKFTGK